MKTKINPYGAMYKYNINFFSKLYKHTFPRRFKKFLGINKPCSCSKSVCKNESPDRDKKDDEDIISTGGHDICNHLTRYEMTSTSDYDSNNWQRRQI